MAGLKRVLAVHDVSCFGKCSLTVALPIISAAGIETTVLPTAVLSTHTGGFEGFTYRDLTEDVMGIVEHWQTLGLHFDAIYSGFLGSFEQIDLLIELISRLKSSDTQVIVDPVMADHGELYGLFPADFPQGIARLCAVADVIIPNTTEAALLLGRDWTPPPYDEAVVRGLCQDLCEELGAAATVLTGVSFDEEHLGAASFEASSGRFALAQEALIPEMYHGTGDVFGSVLVAALVRGATLAQAAEAAVRFTVASIARSYEAGTDNRYGVDFENGLAGLVALIEEVKAR
ncbi:MAG: pyridoxamine kinase [Coriobacteriia bacterium]|nr:pyridoxamine kinase [Coriobacteriia bacterium]